MTPPSHSVSALIERLRDSDPSAARQLWERFFSRMVAVARRRLAGSPRRVADEEDAALSAFLAFDRGARAGRFPDLKDRDDLWGLLFTLTVRAAGAQARDAARLKRGGGEVRGDSALLPAVAAEGEAPDEEAAFQDHLRRALELLGDDGLRQVALARLEGYSTDEIAQRQGCSAPTVRRRLLMIRLTWSELFE